MPKFKKVKGNKVDEKIAKKQEAEKKIVEKEIKKNDDKPKKEKVDLGKYSGMKIGTTVIRKNNPKTINGIEYVEIHLANGTTTILKEADLEKQAKK